MLRITLATALASVAAAQTPTNVFEIYSGCTNYTSRDALDVNAGEILMKIPASHFSGIGMDNAGTGTRLDGFAYFTQDQSAWTQETYSMVLRSDLNGAPDCSAAGLCVRVGPLTTPPSQLTTPEAWEITTMLATPATNCLPACQSFYVGGEVAAAPMWTSDGQSFHICSYYLMGGQQADNPAPRAPNLAYSCLGGAPVQSISERCARIGIVSPAAVLNLGNFDPTINGTANCVSRLMNRSFGAGGLWPQGQGNLGPRNDGLEFRVRDAANPAGFAMVFLGASQCPGVPLPGLAEGALLLNPTGLLHLTTTVMTPAGVGTGTLFPPVPEVGALANRAVDFQAFSVAPNFRLPGRLTNRARVTYLR